MSPRLADRELAFPFTVCVPAQFLRGTPTSVFPELPECHKCLFRGTDHLWLPCGPLAQRWRCWRYLWSGLHLRFRMLLCSLPQLPHAACKTHWFLNQILTA